jgi:hypothetical protein
MRPLALVPLLLAGCAEDFELDSVVGEEDSAFPDVTVEGPADSPTWFPPAGVGTLACTAASQCDDANACTTDECVDGACVHADAVFDDENPCTLERCDPVLGFSAVAIADSDGDPCTEDLCIPEFGYTIHPPVRVDDEDVCTLDFCDSESGIYREPLDCDDASDCTLEKCLSHFGCVYTPVTYFADDFSRPDQWTLGAGFDVERGTPDVVPPSEDAEVPNTALVVRDREALPFAEVQETEATSVPIDLGGISTRAWLSFDYAVTGPIRPGTVKVRVFDGERWHDVAILGGEDAPRWQHSSIDVTEHAGPGFRVQFVADTRDVRLLGVAFDDVRILPEESCP